MATRFEGVAAGANRRESSRIHEANSRRVLDVATRQRRLNRQLEALEKDNFQSDPFEQQETPQKKRPKFAISVEPEAVVEPDTPQDLLKQPASKKKKRTRGDHFKRRFRKTFTALLEEERQARDAEKPNYFNCSLPPSRFPARKFCAVCGAFSKYTCVSCGAQYCCVRCLGTHQDTRCLKWTV